MKITRKHIIILFQRVQQCKECVQILYPYLLFQTKMNYICMKDCDIFSLTYG